MSKRTDDVQSIISESKKSLDSVKNIYDIWQDAGKSVLDVYLAAWKKTTDSEMTPIKNIIENSSKTWAAITTQQIKNYSDIVEKFTQVNTIQKR